MNVIVRKSRDLQGEVSAPSSKAYTHRTLVAALLSNGTSEILNPLVSDDTETTLQSVETFGGEAETHKNCWKVKGEKLLKVPEKPIDCGESGATLRFMIPVAALASGASIFTFRASLEKRPIVPLLQSLSHLGTESSLQRREGSSFIEVRGRGIRGGRTSIRGDISSQFISGLLFACPKAREKTEITITPPLESRSYVKMTLEVLTKHGIRASTSSDFGSLSLPPNQEYNPCNHRVPGDFSSAAFLLAAAAITSSKVKVKNLDQQTTQGDKAILDILEEMGSKIRRARKSVEVEGRQLSAFDVDVKDTPDLVPVYAVLACYSKGTSRIRNAKRLRYKESDRLASIHSELRKMGANILMRKDGLMIKGPCTMHGATVDPHNDHRIAMACAIAALNAVGETKIQNSECVNKSYPRFYDDLCSIGANVIGR